MSSIDTQRSPLAEQTNNEQGAQPFRLNIESRRPSFTQRLMGQSRDWIQNFYLLQEKDDQLCGHGFGDEIDDFVPASIYNNSEMRRRRTSLLVAEFDPVQSASGSLACR